MTIRCEHPEELSRRISERFDVQPRCVGDTLRIEQERGHELLRDLVEAFSAEVMSVSLAKPTLEDVFINRTGHRFWDRPSTGGDRGESQSAEDRA